MKGTTDIAKPGYREVLRDNIISWLDYSLVQINGIININPDQTAYGRMDILGPVNNSFTEFASRRGNWVWEPNYGYNITGVYVDNTLVTSGYSINYRDGVIKFDNPVSGVVNVSHSIKYVEVFNAQDNSFFRLDTDSFNVSDGYFISGSGNILPKDKVHLPAIAVEVVNRDTRTPYEIGNTSHFRNTQVLLRVLANDDSVSSRIADFLTDQKETSIRLFDSETVARSGYYPLNYDGTINYVSGYHSHLSNTFPYTSIKNSTVSIVDAYSEDLNYITRDLCKVTVRMNIESVTK